jgi:hypothetical protein
MLVAVTIALVALSSSQMLVENNNVLARFFPSFTQFYRSASPQASEKVSSFAEQEPSTTKRYRFLFNEFEYASIRPESFSMVHTDVVERKIVYHPVPNFEMQGSRYYYRRDPKQMESVEIELVRPYDRLFREVKRPDRYFYLSSFDGLEYTRQMPEMPYYEVIFTCNSSSVTTDKPSAEPLLTYIDTRFQWSPRYMLDLPMYGSAKKPEMFAYADLENVGLQSITVKGTELIAGDMRLMERPSPMLNTPASYQFGYNMYTMPQMSQARFTHPFGEQTNGLRIYQLPQRSIVLPPRSTTSIPFFEPHVNIAPFLYYNSPFTPINTKGKLFKTYNITAVDEFMPAGRLVLQEQGRFLGQMNLPDLTVGETYTMQFGYDADVAYRRVVKMVQGREDSEMITYNVQITFENFKTSDEVMIGFTESFSAYKYFEVNEISMNNENMPNLVLCGTELQGRFKLRQGGQKMISYNVVLYKIKPHVHDQ